MSTFDKILTQNKYEMKYFVPAIMTLIVTLFLINSVTVNTIARHSNYNADRQDIMSKMCFCY